MFEKIFFASMNPEKVRESSSILGVLGIEVVSASDSEGYPDVEETGSTFVENAVLKAKKGFSFSGMPSIGEDAGLEVISLDYEPGIRSSRYKSHLTQEEKNRDIVKRLENMKDRTARFRSAMVLVYGNPEHPEYIVAEGFCYGRIADRPEGDNGFGYDPIFLVPEQKRTFAQMEPVEKNRISHRRNALRSLAARIELVK